MSFLKILIILLVLFFNPQPVKAACVGSASCTRFICSEGGSCDNPGDPCGFDGICERQTNSWSCTTCSNGACLPTPACTNFSYTADCDEWTNGCYDYTPPPPDTGGDTGGTTTGGGSGSWGSCGSCSTCMGDHGGTECVLSPEGVCLWDPGHCSTCTSSCSSPYCGGSNGCGGTCSSQDDGEPGIISFTSPTNNIAVMNDTGTLTLSWNAATLAERYNYRIYPTGEDCTSPYAVCSVSSTTSRSVTFTPDNNGGNQYTIDVQPINTSCPNPDGSYDYGQWYSTYFTIFANINVNFYEDPNGQASLVGDECQLAGASPGTLGTGATLGVEGLNGSYAGSILVSTGQIQVPFWPAPADNIVTLDPGETSPGQSMICTCPSDCRYTGIASPQSGVNFYVADLDLTHSSWYQSVGGNIYAANQSGSGLLDPIPVTTCDANASCISNMILKDLSIADYSAGLAFTGGGSIDSSDEDGIQTGYITERDTQAFATGTLNTTVKENYDYFYREFSMGTAPADDFSNPTDASKPSSAPANERAYFHSGDLTIQSQWAVTAGESYVIFVDGNLNISDPSAVEQLITVEEGGYLAFIVSGNINIDPSVGYDDLDTLTVLGGSGGSSSLSFDTGDGTDGDLVVASGTTTLDTDANPSGFDFSSVSVAAGATLTASGSNPLIIRSQGTVDIQGTLHVNGGNGVSGSTSNCTTKAGGVAVAGGGDGGNGATCTGAGADGSGDGAGGGTINGNNGGAGGGGGAGFGTDGTDGQNGTGAGEGGIGGTAYGSSDLLTLEAGSGGGGGGGNSDDTPVSGGAGGAGGGAIRIDAPTINVSGSIQANGGNGGGGSTSITESSAGGGGSGGAILLSANDIDISSGSVTANGGSGGNAAADGGNGGSGRIALYYTDTLAGTSNPSAYTNQFTEPAPGDPSGDSRYYTNIEGVFIANGSINTPGIGVAAGGDKRFVAAGTYVGWSGVNLGRDFEDTTIRKAINNVWPVEMFIFRPDFVANTPDRMLRSRYIWQETN